MVDRKFHNFGDFGEVAKQEERAAMAPRLSEASSENEEEESLGSIIL